MKRFITYILLILLTFFYMLVSALSYVHAVSYNLADNVFRLHVIANSNSQQDQSLKYQVRDKIIEHVRSIGQNAHSKQELIQLINTEDLQYFTQKAVYDLGYSYPVQVEIGNFPFPSKTYGDITLPSGFYDAIRVKIGKAEGKNWWCVMFPPLCFVDVSSGIVPDDSKENLKNHLDQEEYALISEQNSDEIKFKLKLVEMFQNFNITMSKTNSSN